MIAVIIIFLILVLAIVISASFGKVYVKQKEPKSVHFNDSVQVRQFIGDNVQDVMPARLNG